MTHQSTTSLRRIGRNLYRRHDKLYARIAGKYVPGPNGYQYQPRFALVRLGHAQIAKDFFGTARS